MATYNHAFDLAFSVSGSEHAHADDCLWDDAERDRTKAALLRRVHEMFEGNEYREALRGFDTDQEEN